jgi:hypothetical protein
MNAPTAAIPSPVSTHLVRVAPVDESRGQRQTEIGAVIAELNQCPLQHAHIEDLAEYFDQRIGHVRRHSPGGEADNQQDEWDNLVRVDQRLLFLRESSPSVFVFMSKDTRQKSA